MSTFKVEVCEIEQIKPHPNADRLDCATLKGYGYEFIIPKDEFRAGDYVVYFPVDSILPNSIIEKLGLVGKLSGAEKNRVKTIKLRKVISQGIVAKQSDLWDTTAAQFNVGEDVTELLGVKKFDPEGEFILPKSRGQMPPYLKPLPEYVSVYDIEGADRYMNIVDEYLMDNPVYISEKVEGSHFSITLYSDDTIEVCQRRFKIDASKLENETRQHAWIKAAQEEGLYDILPIVRDYLQQKMLNDDDMAFSALTLRGELIGEGVQGNIYKRVGHEIFVFEIEVNGNPIDADLFVHVVSLFNIKHVPMLYIGGSLRDWLKGETIKEASNGTSVLANIKREGIVIRPLHEQYDDRFGRVILKARSPEYLAESDL